MKKNLRNYEQTINFDIIEELLKIFEEQGEEITSTTLDPIIRQKIKEIRKYSINKLLGSITDILEASPNILPKVIFVPHTVSRNLLAKILKKARLTIDDYIYVLDDLYTYNLINNIHTIFWCEDCSLDNIRYMEYHGRLSPSKIAKSKLKCPICGKNQSYSSIFSLDNLLKEAIFSKDGFLLIYLGWLLKDRNIEYSINKYSSKCENDIIVDGGILIECKMFKSEKDDSAKRSELENCIKQIIKHIEGLGEDGEKIKYAYLVWNRYEKPDNFLVTLRSKYKDFLAKYNFKVFGPNDFDELVNLINKFR